MSRRVTHLALSHLSDWSNGKPLSLVICLWLPRTHALSPIGQHHIMYLFSCFESRETNWTSTTFDIRAYAIWVMFYFFATNNAWGNSLVRNFIAFLEAFIGCETQAKSRTLPKICILYHCLIFVDGRCFVFMLKIWKLTNRELIGSSLLDIIQTKLLYLIVQDGILLNKDRINKPQYKFSTIQLYPLELKHCFNGHKTGVHHSSASLL